MNDLSPKMVISVVLLSITMLFIPVLDAYAEEPTIEEVTPLSFDAMGTDYYDIRTDSFESLTTSGKLQLTFQGSAELEVKLVDSGDIDPSKWSVRLENEENWKDLGSDGWVKLGSFSGDGETVTYELRFSPDGNTRPGSYNIGLQFSLSQAGGCYDPVIDIRQRELGPDENPKVKLTSSCGPIVDAQVNANPGGALDTGNDGETPNFGNLGSLTNLNLGITLDGNQHENLDGSLQFQFDGINVDGDFQVLVSGAIGPGESVTLTVREQGPGGGGGNKNPIKGAEVSGYASGYTEDNGEFTFTLPESRDFKKTITVGVDSADQDAELVFDYDFTP